MDHSEAKRIVEFVVFELTDWASWMRNDKDMLRLWYPSRSAVLRGSDSSSFDEMCEESDSQRRIIVNSIVDDLPASNKAAINRRYLGVTVRFPRNNYEELLLDAHMIVYEEMGRRGLCVL